MMVGNAAPTGRIGAIDALRGLVMLVMLADHTREIFHTQVPLVDPMDLAATPPEVVLSRLSSHLCAPVFLLLTGVSAWLYGRKHGSRSGTAGFLLKRGLFLVVLEVTLVNLAWTRSLLPPVLYLQVIWAIGLSMVALAGLLWLPRAALLAVALGLMFGHNLLDGIVLGPDEPGYVVWSILHRRGLIALPWGTMARTSYPILPWIGVIAAGYALGPLYAPGADAGARLNRLVGLGVSALATFLVLRGLDGYGDPVAWRAGEDGAATARAFLNLTKYPPSAAFLLATLAVGFLLLALFERLPDAASGWLRVFGGAPMFFYLTHLWLLRLLHEALVSLGYAAPSGRVELGSVARLWLTAAALGLVLYPACSWMIRLKRRTGWKALSYL